MKKILSIFGCAVFVAAMAVSCGQKNNETNDSVCDSMQENALVDDAVQQVAPAPEMSEAEHQAMLDAAREAGRHKCECYKTDAASVENCIKSILAEKYAQYQNNEEFRTVMEEEFNTCVKEKASEAVGQVVNEGVSAGAKAISNLANKKK